MASSVTVRIRSVVLLASVLLLAGTALATAPANAVTATAFVRVNQIGYPAASAKRAFLMASDVETGATFSLTSGGSAAFSGTVGADLGTWSSAYPHVYALDFTSFSTAGTYSIDVAGPIAATSPSFRIGTGSTLYSQALTNARSFYGNERDGAGYIPSPLRTAPGHLNDQNAMTYLTPHANQTGHFKGDLTPLGLRIDASGGWWDAGDYLKFVQTSSYTEDLLLAGVRDMPAQMGSTSTTSNFTAEAKFGIQWLLKMWDDPTGTLYYQVGIGTGNAKTRGDHDIWRLPQADDTFGGTDPLYRYIRNRPVFRAGPPGSPSWSRDRRPSPAPLRGESSSARPRRAGRRRCPRAVSSARWSPRARRARVRRRRARIRGRPVGVVRRAPRPCHRERPPRAMPASSSPA